MENHKNTIHHWLEADGWELLLMNQRESDEMDHANKMLKKIHTVQFGFLADVLVTKFFLRCREANNRIPAFRIQMILIITIQAILTEAIPIQAIRIRMARTRKDHKSPPKIGSWQLDTTDPKPAWVHFKKSVHSSGNHFKIRRESQSIAERVTCWNGPDLGHIRQGDVLEFIGALWREARASLHWLHGRQCYSSSMVLLIVWSTCPHAVQRIHLYKHIFRNFKID